jgi:hypothetical protein
LLYRCWDEFGNGLRIDEVLLTFIKYSFDPEPDASWSVVTHCSFMVCLKWRMIYIFWTRGKVICPFPLSAGQLVMPLYSQELGTVMDRIYARLVTMAEPAPPQKLPLIDNVRKIALTVELIRPLAVSQSLNRLFNVFVASRNLVLDEEIKSVAEKESNQATIELARLVLSAARIHPSQTPSVRNLSDSLKFLGIHLIYCCAENLTMERSRRPYGPWILLQSLRKCPRGTPYLSWTRRSEKSRYPP